ncbi:MAG TPA: PQQ-binding-like beta-propeller repeat protein, partial [Actinomycetota bacterium]|nr:PQQ-binding-like beta-propeller repeat protein [Actinomycetota bacterium]
EGFAASIVARRLEDGRERWRFRLGAAVLGGFAADEERVYAGSRAGEVVAVGLEDGEEAWRFRAGGRVETAPAAAEGLVVAVAENYRTGEASVVALEAESGRRAWAFSAPGPDVGASSPAIGRGTVFVGLGDGRVRALDLRTGQERWAAPVLATSLGARAFTPELVPAVPGDLVVADVAHVYRLDAATGEERWSFRISELLFRGGPAVSDGAVLVGDDGGGLSAISLEEGVRVWRADLGPAPLGALAVAADRVFAAGLGRGGRVVALETDDRGALSREASDSELSVGRALLNFIAAAAAVGAVVLVLFRLVLRVRPREPAEAEP